MLQKRSAAGDGRQRSTASFSCLGRSLKMIDEKRSPAIQCKIVQSQFRDTEAK
jgi:hypothetical protein